MKLTYSDNLLLNGDFSFQQAQNSDELLQWHSVNENAWCDRFSRQGYLEVDCATSHGIGKTFYVTLTTFGFKNDEIYEPHSFVWLQVSAGEKYILRYKFKGCLTKAYVLGLNVSNSFGEIATSKSDECAEQWTQREIKFEIPRSVKAIAIMFEHNNINGYIDDVELLAVAENCYDSDVKEGEAAIYKKGYVKIGEKKTGRCL